MAHRCQPFSVAANRLLNANVVYNLRPVARGVRLVRPNPLSRQQYMYTCNCCGPSCKLPNISVKIQLNLHQNEPFQVKKSQNFLGRVTAPPQNPPQLVPEPPLFAGAVAVKASESNQPLSYQSRTATVPRHRHRLACGLSSLATTSHQSQHPSSLFPSLPVLLLPLHPVSSPQRHEATPLKPARGSGEALYSPELQRGSEQSPRLQLHFAALYARKTHCLQHFWFFGQHSNEWQNEMQSVNPTGRIWYLIIGVFRGGPDIVTISVPMISTQQSSRAISRKRLEIETPFQRTTNRK